MHGRELGGRPVPWKIGQAIYLVARAKIRDIGRRLLYHAGWLVSRDAWNPRGAIGVLIGLIPSQFLGRDARRAYPYQHIPRPSHRHRRILEKQLLRPAPAVSPDCFHGNPSFSTILPRGRAVLFGKAAQRRLGRIVPGVARGRSDRTSSKRISGPDGSLKFRGKVVVTKSSPAATS